MSMTDPLRVAVIGGGYSGAILIRHLIDASAGRALAVDLFEPRAEPGRGVAYSPRAANLLLNVPTNRMLPFRDRPGLFHDFALGEGGWPARAAEPDGGIYTTRALFGDFTASLLNDAVTGAKGRARLTHRRQDAVALERDGASLLARGAEGAAVRVDAVALALGNPPPRRLADIVDIAPGLDDVIDDPWDLDRVAAIRPDAPVLILGTGLTMADMVSTLAAQGHRGPIAAVSRRGLVPLVMKNTRVTVDRDRPDDYPADAAALVRTVRARFEAAARDKGDWRFAMDRVRLDVPVIWRAMAPDARARLMRHARPYWDIHRFRMPPPTHRVVEGLRAEGRLTVLRGRLAAIGAGMARAVGPDGRDVAAPAAVVLNCTGPDYRYEGRGRALLDSLAGQGLIADRRLRGGFEIDARDRLIPAHGKPAPIFAIGPSARLRYGELTTATEISAQARAVAGAMLKAASRQVEREAL